jgi:hypothetical protein
MSIHKLTGEDGTEEVVAVLTNNDKTVRIYSLTHGLEITVLDLPFPINHATISPDGQYLVAVGDEQEAFFFEKLSKSKRAFGSKTTDSRIYSTPPEWSLISRVQLHVPPSSMINGYFTTAWSPSGKLIAVGSECGYITVFDMDLVLTSDWGEDAIVQIIRSSRPDTIVGPGAVRTMCFSPQPWDLLIWSEDHGRVCVADLRTGLRTKQTVELNPDADEVEHVDVVDIDGDFLGMELTPSEREHLLGRGSGDEPIARRLYQRAVNAVRALEMERERNMDDGEPPYEYSELSDETRRRSRQPTEDEPRSELTANERQILDALRTTRNRQDEQHEQDTRQRTNQNLRALHAELDRLYPRSSGASAEAPSRPRADISSLSDFPPLNRERSTSIGSATAGGLPSLGTLRDFLDRERERERERSTPEADRGSLFQPRRRSSVVLLNEGASLNSASPSRSSSNTLRADPQASSDAWRTIEAVISRSPQPISSRARGTPPHYTAHHHPATGSSNTPPPAAQSATATLTSVEARRQRQLNRARERMARAAYDQQRRGVGLMSRTGNAEWGLRTAGLAMSKDGRRLFVGTEAGIFELALNLGNRQSLPAVSFR